MMKKPTKKLTARAVYTLIACITLSVFVLALLITNLFVPVKYLSAYAVKARRVPEGTLRVTFVDVGYGDSIIIELPDGKNMLIDAGNGRYKNQNRIFKQLNRRGISQIDYLVCSSVNAEHCGGLKEVVQHKQINKAYIPFCANTSINKRYRAFSKSIANKKVNTAISEYGAGEGNGDYFFTFLSPSVHTFEGGAYANLNKAPSLKNRNNASAVIWLEYKGVSFLFLSDAGKDSLSSIWNSYTVSGADYPVTLTGCNFVQVAGHANAGSSGAEFYSGIAAKNAILSTGSGIDGGPSPQTVADILSVADCNLFRTDECGTLTVTVTQDGKYTLEDRYETYNCR